MRINEDWRHQFTLANNFCLLELIWVALGHLDELQKAERYPIRWSLYTGFTVVQRTHRWSVARLDQLQKCRFDGKCKPKTLRTYKGVHTLLLCWNNYFSMPLTQLYLGLPCLLKKLNACRYCLLSITSFFSAYHLVELNSLWPSDTIW